MNEPGFDGSNRPVQVVDFDYDAIDSNLGSSEPQDASSMDEDAEVIRDILEWIWDGGKLSREDICLRIGIAAWKFLPICRVMSLRTIRGNLGQHSEKVVDTLVAEFERRFPELPEGNRTAKALRVQFAWVWNYTPTNLDGLVIRAAILSWIWIPHLRSMTETQLSLMLPNPNGVGKAKQSVERWVDPFKLRFPEARNQHMRTRDK